MEQWLSPVCSAVDSANGDMLIRLMAEIYWGHNGEEAVTASFPATVVSQAQELGLIRDSRGRFLLTDDGYLVANACKEYCHWLSSGRHVEGAVPPEQYYKGRDVLDVGCSFGRWLWLFQRSAKSVLGLEMQPAYIELGKTLARREGISVPEIRCGSAMDLDRYIPRDSMDFVFSRLVMNHVLIKMTLTKIREILRPEGILWLQVESMGTGLRKFCRSFKDRRLRSIVFSAFGVANSLSLICLGKQFSLRSKGRMHQTHMPAYPTVGYWRRTLKKLGFHDFKLESQEHFAFSARLR